jgi:molecular chaperone DnaJ
VGKIYDIMGVTSDATAEQIRKAYKKLALKLHPDKQKTEEERKNAHEIFTRMLNAYEVLIDEHKRRSYDFMGSAKSGKAGGTSSSYQSHAGTNKPKDSN